MIKAIVIASIAFAPTFAFSEDAPAEKPAEKPANVCHTTCQPLPTGRHQVCSKHCWSYKGGAAAVLVQTTVTWTSGIPQARKTPTPVPAPGHPTEVSQSSR